MDWGFTIAVVITGIVVVFVVLSVLVMLCSGMGAFFSTENQAPPKVEPIAQPKITEEQPTTTPIIEDGISQEVVAAISASLAVIMGEENANYKITSVKHAKNTSSQNVKGMGRNAWASAGFAENTRPF